MDTINALRKYNRWRRGLEAWHDDAEPSAKEIGEHLDAAVAELEAGRMVFEAAENLRKQKGRHNTELAYQWLMEAVSAYKLRTPNDVVQGRLTAASSPAGVRWSDGLGDGDAK